MVHQGAFILNTCCVALEDGYSRLDLDLMYLLLVCKSHRVCGTPWSPLLQRRAGHEGFTAVAAVQLCVSEKEYSQQADVAAATTACQPEEHSKVIVA